LGGGRDMGQLAMTSPQAAMEQLWRLRGVLKGCSLRTVVHVVFRAGGVEDDGITFRQFKARFGTDVRMIATNLSALGPQVFSVETTPDVRVMDAAVSSMAIPLMFEPQHVPGVGDCVDGGVVDPYGMIYATGSQGKDTLWLCKEIHMDKNRRADSIMSVICGCMASFATATQHFTTGGQLSRLNFIPLRVGSRHGCDEREVSSAVDLFSSRDPSGLLMDGMESAEATVLCAWLAIACMLRGKRGQRSRQAALSLSAHPIEVGAPSGNADPKSKAASELASVPAATSSEVAGSDDRDSTSKV
jgi:hypothetical protein